MLEGREFGLPKKGRNVKVDPYEGIAVLIIHKAPEEGSGKTYKFELSKQALIDLDLVKKDANDEKLVSFSFSDDVPVLGNTTSLKGKIESSSQYNVSMSGIFSNKDAHEYLTKELGLDNTKDNVINVLKIDDDSIPMGQLLQLSIQEDNNISINEELANGTLDEVNEEINTVVKDEEEVPFLEEDSREEF